MRTFKFGKHKYYFWLSEYPYGGTLLKLCEKRERLPETELSVLITNEDGENIFLREPDKICLYPDFAPELYMCLQLRGFMTDIGESEIDAGIIYPVMKLNIDKIRRYSVKDNNCIREILKLNLEEQNGKCMDDSE